MSFAVEFRHWSTVELFRASLPVTAPIWAKGVSPHHTDIPRVSQWRGQASMNGLLDFYIGKDWSAGPHLFLCAGAPNPAHDGIWQLTPLRTPGIHAGVCNSDHWGLEVVGNYDAAPWPPILAELVYGVMCVLLGWRKLKVTTTSVRGHRECLPNKTCPGAAIDMNIVRAELARRMEPAPPADTLTADSPIMAQPRCTQAQAAAYILGREHPNYTSADIRLSILPAYWEVCTRVGLDPCIALAQMIHETGNLSSFWSARPQRNPAGLGVTGQPGVGLSFPSWAGHAIPAHVGRLLAYATKPAERTPTQQRLVSEALGYRALPNTYHGVAPTLRGLDGRWAAPGRGYGASIAAIAEAMTEEQI